MPSSRGGDVGRVAANRAQPQSLLNAYPQMRLAQTLERQMSRKLSPCRARADTSELHLSL
jgi:hypothetical protein